MTHALGLNRFFITLAPCEHLNTKHTIFGHVLSGQEILDRMAKVPVDRKDRPLSDITIARSGELDAPQKPLGSAETAPRSKNPVQGHRSDRPSRGRETAKRSPAPSSSSRTHSDFRSRSPSPHADAEKRRHDHHHKKLQTRRRSDVAIDETRRGRSLTRSPSPDIPSSRTGTRSRPQHYRPPPSGHLSHRKRSPPPSRPHSRPRSRSPHLRRRRTRSRSRRDRNRDRGGNIDALRRKDEDALREVEEEREGGRARWDEGSMMEGVERYDERRGDRYPGSGYRRNRGGRGQREARGGGSGGDYGGGEEAVQFKGRGSMKYLEKG